MPQSLTIAVSSAWELASFASLLEAVAHDVSAQFSTFERQLQVAPKNVSWYVVARDVTDQAGCAEDYATNEDLDERFRREAPALRYFDVGFNNFDVTRRFLRAFAREAVARGETAWVDTDYGWVIEAEELLRRLERDPSWDWRTLEPRK